MRKKTKIYRAKRRLPSAARKMTDEQVLAAAKSDPDALPSTDAQLRKARRITAVKRLRWELELTQEAFAERYGIPVATVRDWEQGRSSPDATAQSYLKLIKTDPKKVARMLEASS